MTDKKCCTYVCHQGRDCPVRQACELAEAEAKPISMAEVVVGYVRDFLFAVGMVTALAFLLGLAWGYIG